jgi:succinate dehydrogenase flavin-adding protein (antitoxin of CptAB toxin-antitoxin module)
MESVNRAKLAWRCRRGMRELDVVLMRYLERDFDTAEATEQASFELLLSLQDPDIYDLLTGRITADDPGVQHVVERLSSDS